MRAFSDEKRWLRRINKTFNAALEGNNAAERAALILSLIAGVQIMRQMIGLTPLAQTSPATLQKLLGDPETRRWDVAPTVPVLNLSLT